MRPLAVPHGWAWPGEREASAWLTGLGLVSGDRIAFGGLNNDNTVQFLAAALRLGLTVIPLNRRLMIGELQALHRRAKVRHTIADPAHPLASAVAITALPTVFRGEAGTGGPLTGSLVLFTSGSTGAAKAVRLGPMALVAAVTAHVAALDLVSSDSWSLPLPLDHVGGIMATLRALHCGYAIVLEATPAPDATGVSIVPTMLKRLVDAETAPPRLLRVALTGGGPLDPHLAERARALGWPVRETYGLTEMGSMVTLDGLPVPGAQIRIADGRILVDGPMRCDGYEHDGVLSPISGWHATGDCGELVDGRLLVTSRVSELIVSGGENVAAVEVENALLAHPLVADAGVVGLPDAHWGEIVAAAVVLRQGLTLSQLDAWLAPRIAGFKRPRRCIVVDALPRSSLGKLQRHTLQAMFANSSPVGDGDATLCVRS